MGWWVCHLLLSFYTYFLDAISREYQQIGTTLPRWGGGVQIRREKAEKGIEIELLNWNGGEREKRFGNQTLQQLYYSAFIDNFFDIYC